jgi:polyhydroxyalkanoate synthesis regulator protein
MAQTPSPTSQPDRHIVKRYAGSRLYDTNTLSYVTADQLRTLLQTNADVTVYDADDGADITRSILASG